jgi:hypothetical protein
MLLRAKMMEMLISATLRWAYPIHCLFNSVWWKKILPWLSFDMFWLSLYMLRSLKRLKALGQGVSMD